MQHFVSNLMHKRGKLLGWLHPGKQLDLAAIRETFCGSNSFGETNLDTLRFNELKQTFAVSAHVAIDFGQRGKFLAFGLADIKNVDGPETVQRPLTFSCCVLTRLVGRYILRASSSDHRSENENAFFSPFNEAAKRVPCPKSGNVSSIGLLPCDEHDVAEAVGVKLRHCSEVCGEDFTVTGLQCCNEEIYGLFGSCVDFSPAPVLLTNKTKFLHLIELKDYRVKAGRRECARGYACPGFASRRVPFGKSLNGWPGAHVGSPLPTLTMQQGERHRVQSVLAPRVGCRLAVSVAAHPSAATCSYNSIASVSSILNLRNVVPVSPAPK